MTSHPDPNAVSAATVSLRILPEESKVEDTLKEASGDNNLSTTAAATDPSRPRKASSRQPHVFLDAKGQERTYGSALGALTRKFIDIVQESKSGAVDMNETANFLGVPKRRIYDITNVLEGVGILEKRSKNTVAWKGSEGILGGMLEPIAKQEMETLRDEIGAYIKEESMLDQWMSHLIKTPTSPNVISCSDIIQALYYPVGVEMGPQTKDELVDETGKPKRALLAIHAPFDSVVQIPMPEDEDQAERQLYVGTKNALEKLGGDGEGAVGKKRKLAYDGSLGANTPRIDDKLQVYLLSTYFDEKEQMIRASELKTLAGESNERSSSWDLAESLANEEGVSDFLATGEEEAV